MANTTNNKDDKTGKMTVQEAGQKGGEATSESHDKKFYEGIGHQGGEATSESHDKKFYQENGSEGGKVSGGNFKNDPKRAAEAGSHSHDNDNKKS